MTKELKKISNREVAFTLLLAVIFWYITFAKEYFNFWLSMGVAVSILSAFSIYYGGNPFKRKELNSRSVVIGVGSAAVLYGVFVLGNFLSQLLFDFAQPQILSIYDIRTQSEAILIVIVLLFVTSPGEEIFWRNFVQRWAMDKYGGFTGMLIASVAYAAVHIPSGNFMLVMAALVAGLFWGFIYWKERNLLAVTISHALWTVGIFVVFPVM